MLKVLKKAWAIMFAVLLFTICFGIFAGCSNSGKTEEETKYNVAIKIVCREVDDQGYITGNILDEVIFTPDISEISVERDFNGKKYGYYIYQYNMPNHPYYSENWLTPTDLNGASWSISTPLYTDLNNKQHTDTLEVMDRGTYVYTIHTYSNSWDFRSCYLYITVK